MLFYARARTQLAQQKQRQEVEERMKEPVHSIRPESAKIIYERWKQIYFKYHLDSYQTTHLDEGSFKDI